MPSAYPIKVKQRDGRTTWSVRLHLPSGPKKTWKVSDYKPTTKTTAAKLAVLIDARRAGEAPPAHVAKWIDGLPDAWRRRLAEFRLLDPIREAGGSAIAEHLDRWEADVQASQRAKGRDDRRARDLRQRVETVVEGAGITRLADLTPERIDAHLAELLEKKTRRSRTVWTYRQALGQFSKWAIRKGLLATNPIAASAPISATGERERRALSEDEQRRLLAAAHSGPVFASRSGRIQYELSGPDRDLLYRVVLTTGLRSREVRTLTRADLRLEGDRPLILLRDSRAKNRKPFQFRLPASLAEALRRHVAKKAPAAPVFACPPSDRMADMIRADLAAARAAYLAEAAHDLKEHKRRLEDRVCCDEDETGAVFDFHSLRVCFVVNLARAGVGLAMAQRLARHSDPRLTSNIYSRFGFDDTDDALARLPDFTPAAVAQAATG